MIKKIKEKINFNKSKGFYVEVYNKVIALFFILLFVGTAYGQTTVSFEKEENVQKCTNQYLPKSNISEINYVFNRGDGCYTVELPKESVSKLWDEILNRGFRINSVESDQPAVPKEDREGMQKSDVLLTQPGAKAGDMTVKQEMPSTLMDPLETPTILGQSCSGSFQFGVDLDSTLRVGRCEDPSNCYLQSAGLFRNNSMTGFFKETGTVFKDAINAIGLKKAKEEVSKVTGKEKDMNIELGVFTDMSLEQVEEYQRMMSSTDANQVKLEKVKFLKDKAIKNSFLTDNFAVDMQTTCRGEDCYINMYSFFDKMFNQYFSADMVLSSASPILLNTAGRLFAKSQTLQNTFEYLPKTLKKTKLIKKGGFWDTLLDDPINLLKNPRYQLNRAWQVGRNKYKVDKVIKSLRTNALKGGTNIVDAQRNLQHHGVWDEAQEMLNKAQNKKEIQEFISEKILKNKNITKAQKAVMTDTIMQQAENAKVLKTFSKVRMEDEVVDTAVKKVDDLLENNVPLKHWGDPSAVGFTDIDGITSKEYDTLFTTGQDLTKVAKENKKLTFGNFKWDDGFDNFQVVKNRKVDYPGLGEVKANKVRLKNRKNIGSLTDDGFGKNFEFEKTSDDIYRTKGADVLDSKKVDVTFADGETLKISRIKPVANTPSGAVQRIGAYDKPALKNIADNNPNDFIRYMDGTTEKIKPVSYLKNEDNLTNLAGKTDFKLVKAKNEILDAEEYGIDPIEIAHAALTDGKKNVVKKLDDYSGNLDDVLVAAENKEWITPRGSNFINQKMKALSNPSYTSRFITWPLKSFGVNLYYWQLRSGFNNFFGSSLGLDKYSMYRLPETYSALNISHDVTPNIYKDAYIDFFANSGSDQGDIFKAFLNSIVFYIPYATKKVIENVDTGITNSLNSQIDKVLKGKIRRNKVDNLALFSDSINTGCSSEAGCRFTISNEKYIESKTYNNSLNISEEEVEKGFLGEVKENYVENQKEKAQEYYTKQKIQEEYAEMDHKLKNLEEQLLSLGTKKEKVDQIIETYRQKYKNTIDLKKPMVEEKVSDKINQVDKSLHVSFTVPGGIEIQNYLIENTSKENFEEKGQTLISFSHHTNYKGTTKDQTGTEDIDLQEAINNQEICEDKLRNLEVLGLPIGAVTPRDYRAVGTMLLTEHASYILMPGYKNAWILGAFTTSLPQQTLIMPEIYGCVDDKEGYYSHFFVSSRAEDVIKSDPKNKVGNMVEEGVDKVEKTLTDITKNTELEKTVKTGTQSAKKFIQKNLKDYPIVQSRFSTSGDTTAQVNGGLFLFEMGPNTSCRANSLVDKGVEILKDKESKRSVKVDKEKGEISVTKEDGSIEKIIGENNSDFVRLTGTNLNIPAKVIPQKLSYIPLPDNNKLLFEIDAAGNLYVQDKTFLECLKEGFKAQAGYPIEDGLNHLEEYLGKVKNVNVINPTGEYNIYPQKTKIVAEGNPRQIADGPTSKISILGNRKTILSKVNNRDSNIGINISIQFENAQLLYSGEKDAYIMWVEYTSVTNSKDIKDLKTEINKQPAINGCEDEELAIDFQATPNTEDKDSQTYANIEKLNKALKEVGPFKIFDTAKKTFIFYLGPPPECEQRLKIIDKETGEVYDEKITNIEETPNGLKVKTEDGKEHEFEFGADNGVPELKYNGDAETLLSAQGREGSFWYDPKTGNWYTENGQLIPFEDGFKDGMMFGVDENGKVTGKEAQNVFNIGQGASGGQSSSPFNIPLTPTSLPYTLLYIFLLISFFFTIYTNKEKILKKI